MTPERLAEIKARCETATPGPWVHEVTSDVQRVGPCAGFEDPYDGGGPRVVTTVIQAWRKEPGRLEDLRFIAHARTDVPDLVAEVERLRAALVAKAAIDAALT